MVICTNKPFAFIEPILDKLLLKQFFKYWIGRAKKMGLEARHKIISQAINLFADKEIITEYNNPKYKGNYLEQFETEIISKINGYCSSKIYDFSINSTEENCGGDFLEEVKNYSNFII